MPPFFMNYDIGDSVESYLIKLQNLFIYQTS